MACVDEVADFEAGLEPLVEDRDARGEMAAPEVDVVPVEMQERPAEARVVEPVV